MSLGLVERVAGRRKRMGIPGKLQTRARQNLSLLVSLSAVFTGVVFAATVVFSLFIPGSGGFFNIGESGVYLAALVAGPYVGSVAGGVGSMLADLFLGFPAWAPGTLLIKAVEGFVVGYVAHHAGVRRLFRSRWVAAVVSLPLAALLFFLGNAFYVGPADVEVVGFGLSTHIVPALWALVAAVLVVAILWLVWANPGQTALIVAMGVGGSFMIAGYFLYGQFILNVGALLEVPFNVAQALIGMAVATYLYRAYQKIYPS